MILQVIKNFKGAEDGINVKEYKKGDTIETYNKKYYDNLIQGKLCKPLNYKENKVVEPKEIKLEDMTVIELKELAKRKGLKNYSNMNKSELLFILR